MMAFEASNLDETLAAYRSMADEYAAVTREFPSDSSLASRLQELAHLSEGLILDAGAGGGRDSSYLASLGCSVIALDACTELLKAGSGDDGVLRLVGDIRSLPLRGDSIAAVWCSAVLLHFASQDVIKALREFYRVLISGGLLCVSVKQGHGRNVVATADGLQRRHFFLYGTDDMARMGSSAGFHVLTACHENELDSAGIEQCWAVLWMRKLNFPAASAKSNEG